MRSSAAPRRAIALQTMDWSILGATVLALLLTVLLARGQSPFRQLRAPSTASVTTAPSTGDSSAASVPAELRLDSEGQYPTDGGAVAVGPSLRASLLVTNPAGADAYRYLDLELTSDSPSLPVNGAIVHASARMAGMNGSIEVNALPRGDGHYFLPIQFPMTGTWRVVVTMRTHGQQEFLPLDVVVR